MSVEDQYTDEIREQLGYLAAWWPNDTIRLGDFGRISGHWFSPEGNVADRWGLDVTPTDPAPTVDVNYSSSGGVSWDIQGDGETKNIPNIPAGSAGIQVAFTRENAVALVTSNTMQQRVRDLYGLQQSIIKLADAGDFPDGYAIVSHVVQAGGTTVLVAKKSGGGLTLTGNATFGFGDIADASLDLSMTSSHELAAQFVAEPGLTPVFRAFSYRKPGFGPGGIEQRVNRDRETPVEIGSSEDETPESIVEQLVEGQGGFQWESAPPSDE